MSRDTGGNVRHLHPSDRPPSPSSHTGPDPWDLDDGTGYDPSKFYTKASTTKGDKGENWQVMVPSSVASQLTAMIQGGKIKHYATRQDFIRDAIYHRLHDIAEMLNDTQLARKLGILYRTSEMLSIREDVQAADDFIDTVRESCRELEDRKEWELLVETLNLAEEHIEVVPTARKAALGEVIDKYRGLLPS